MSVCVICFDIVHRGVYCVSCTNRCSDKVPPWHAHALCIETAGNKCPFCAQPLRLKRRTNKAVLFFTWLAIFMYVIWWMWVWCKTIVMERVSQCVFDSTCPAYAYCMNMWYTRNRADAKYWPHPNVFLFGECVSDIIRFEND